MKKFDFTKLPNSKSTYGKKNIEQGIENTKHNDFLIEIAKRLADK